jgi:hypothetical protein
MTSPLPPLSELLSWSTTHLTAGADYWDSVKANNAADDLRDDARAARHGASDVSTAQSRLREAVGKVRDAGFDVGDDCTVTSHETGCTAAQ